MQIEVVTTDNIPPIISPIVLASVPVEKVQSQLTAYCLIV